MVGEFMPQRSVNANVYRFFVYPHKRSDLHKSLCQFSALHEINFNQFTPRFYGKYEAIEIIGNVCSSGCGLRKNRTRFYLCGEAKCDVAVAAGNGKFYAGKLATENFPLCRSRSAATFLRYCGIAAGALRVAGNFTLLN